MGTPGSVTRLAALHPLLAVVIFALGVYSMRFPVDVAQAAAARGHAIGLRPLLMAAELMLIAPAVITLLLLRRPLRAALALEPRRRGTIVASLGAGAALWAASLGLLELQSVRWPPSEAFLETFRQLHAQLKPKNAVDALFSVAAIAVFPAVCEEILFRGVVLPAFARGLGARAAVVTSALLFGLIHVDLAGDTVAFTRIPFAILVGAGLGLLRVRTGSLVPPILGHAVLNTITFLTVVLTGVEMETQTPDVVLGATTLAGGLVLAAIALRHAHPSSTPPEQAARLAG